MNVHTLERLRKIAKKASESSSYKIKLGAAVFKKHRVISIGYNSTKTHPMLLKYFKHGTVHAEVACTSGINRELLKGADIFVFRESKEGMPLLSRPCGMCVQVLNEHGIKRAFWTTPDFPYWETDLIENMYNQIDKKECYETNCRKPKNPPQGKKGNNYEGR